MTLRAALLGLSLLLAPAIAQAESLTVLVEERAAAEYGPTLPEAGVFDVVLQAGGLTEARLLSGFWIDLSTGQFVADAVTDMGEVKRIMGLATVSVPVPVPVRRMMPEEIIDERDLTIVNLPHARVGAFAVTDSAKLVGMEVRSLLAQGRPVMNRAVRQPLVIDRGDRVNIRYSDGLLELSAPGRALGEAHRGQEVKIVNLVSNTSVVGIATAEGTVEVIR